MRPIDLNARLLAICPIGIGNFLLLVPTLENLKKSRPDIKITLLSLKPGIASLARRFNIIDEIISIDAGKKQSFYSKLNVIKHLHRKFDFSIAFFPSNRMEYNLLPFISRIPVRIAFKYKMRSLQTLSMLNNSLVPVKEGIHDLLQNFRTLEEIGIQLPGEFLMPHFPLMENESMFARDFISQNKLTDKYIIGLHPGSSAENNMEKKRWPISNFFELAGMISNNPKAFFLIFGGPEEKDLKGALQKRIGPNSISVETGSIFETAAVIAQCKRFISNDSGLMHIAVSSGVKSCGIFGPTDDVRTAPFGQGNIVVRGPDGCSPCWTIRNVGKREACIKKDFPCLKDLTPAYVYDKIKEWL